MAESGFSRFIPPNLRQPLAEAGALGYQLLDNVVGFDDGYDSMGELLKQSLREDPVGTAGSIASGVVDSVKAAYDDPFGTLSALGDEFVGAYEMLSAPMAPDASREEVGQRLEAAGLLSSVIPVAGAAGAGGKALSGSARAALPDVEDLSDLLEYNTQARVRQGFLDRDVVPENAAQLLLRQDRNYRYIGEDGYSDFLESGVIRGRPESKKDYGDAYFMRGKPSGRYASGGGDRYLVETPHGEDFRLDTSENYARPPRDLTGEDPIRIFELGPDGQYRVVLDNIGDRAFLPEEDGFRDGGMVTASEYLLAGRQY